MKASPVLLPGFVLFIFTRMNHLISIPVPERKFLLLPKKRHLT